MTANPQPQNVDLYGQFSPVMLEQLQAHQEQYRLPNLDAAVIHALGQFFDDALPLLPQSEIPVAPEAKPEFTEVITEINQRISSLGREVVNVRLQVPQEYDRLREQLAAVRLSHSGLLHNLRERIEAIEKVLGLAETPPD